MALCAYARTNADKRTLVRLWERRETALREM